MVTVTKEMVEDHIIEEQDCKMGEKTTIVLLKLRNGFEVAGASSCVDASSYDHEIGKRYAREKALSQAWQVLAYQLQERLSKASERSAT